MKRLLAAFAISFGYASAVWAASPAPLTTLRAIHALSNAEASQHSPVAFEATVTYFPGYEKLLFVQDGDAAIFVLATTDAKLVPGDRVLIKGTMRESFKPIVVSNDVTVLRHDALPKLVPAGFSDLILGQRDCMLVTVRAVVRTANLMFNPTTRVTYLQMLMDGGYIDATVDSDDENALKNLLDAEVEVTGVAGGKFNDKMQQTGILLHVPSFAFIKILKPANSSIWDTPVTPMDKILSGYYVQYLTRRIRVKGTITYYQPGSAIVLQDGAKSLWITTPTRSTLQIGDLTDASGFPEAHEGFLTLTHGEILDSHVQAPVTPQPVTSQQLAFWSANQPNGHQYDLVTIEGQVTSEVREVAQDKYVLVSDNRLFTAIYRHPDATSQFPLPSMKQIPLGSKVLVTGICMIEGTNQYNTSMEVPFNILMRSYDDITVAARPSMLNVHNLILLVGFLLTVVVTVVVRGWALERRVRRQTAAMADLEQRRSRILEDINGSRPIAEIVEKITEMVSFGLHGVPCWCQITDGARLGDWPPHPDALRIVPLEIPARSGPQLGTLFAGLDPQKEYGGDEAEALSMGARLAALAIETRRLNADLTRRSEFDLLTDIHNRFSLEKQLEARIEVAREQASIFGLIYIDLDDFKQVNDLYGHHIGDLYLQEAALRMKRQLRPQDMLARLGGDEFAILASAVHNRADVEEIALRLERCFDDPFTVEGHLLRGSASVGIALYPEDGDSKDSLLNVADAAMYVVKKEKKLR